MFSKVIFAGRETPSRGISSGENNLRKHLRKWPSKKFWLVLQIHIQSKLFRRSFSKVFSKVIFAGRETPLLKVSEFIPRAFLGNRNQAWEKYKSAMAGRAPANFFWWGYVWWWWRHHFCDVIVTAEPFQNIGGAIAAPAPPPAPSLISTEGSFQSSSDD